jgi:acyl carrier protein
MGIGSLDPDLALGSLEGLMSSRWTQKAVVRVDWDALFNSDPAAGRSPFLSSFSAGRIGDAGPAPWPDAILSELGSLSAVGRSERLTAYLSELIGRVLKRREPIGPRQGFFELGLDSIMALELKAKLEAGLGRTFRATLFFTHPTLESLVDYLLGEGLGLEPPRSRAEGGPEATPADPPAEVFSEQTIAQMIAREIDAPIGTPRRG